jgi:hypothetical protein
MSEDTREEPEAKATRAAGENLTAARAEQSGPVEVPTPTPEAFEPAEGQEEPRTPRKGSKRPKSPRGQVVGSGETDPVFLSRARYKNPLTRKSLTVHHLQRRLAELGYSAGADQDGLYGDITLAAVAEYQKDEGIDTDSPGAMDEETLTSIFRDDPNVRVVLVGGPA